MKIFPRLLPKALHPEFVTSKRRHSFSEAHVALDGVVSAESEQPARVFRPSRHPRNTFKTLINSIFRLLVILCMFVFWIFIMIRYMDALIQHTIR